MLDPSIEPPELRPRLAGGDGGILRPRFGPDALTLFALNLRLEISNSPLIYRFAEYLRMSVRAIEPRLIDLPPIE